MAIFGWGGRWGGREMLVACEVRSSMCWFIDERTVMEPNCDQQIMEMV